MLHFAAACGLGLAAGLAFAWIWLRIVPPGTHQRYWSSMSGLTREMLRVEETDAFLRLYGRLFRLLGPYLARNLGGSLLGCLPMVALLLILPGPPAGPGDVNPLSPYVSDLEAVFFLVFMLTMTIALLWPTRKRSSSPATMPSSG